MIGLLFFYLFISLLATLSSIVGVWVFRCYRKRRDGMRRSQSYY